MKELKKDLQAVTKSLKQLTKKTEQIAKKLEKAHATKAKLKLAKKGVTKKPIVKKAAHPLGIDLVFNIIKKSKKGVDTATLKDKTGFSEKKVWNTINMLKRKRMVRSAGRGIYVKA